MFDEQSRYAHLETREFEAPDGRRIIYVRRRLIPAAASYIEASRISVTDSDRLDLIAYRTLGVPTAFWQIADANEAMHPGALTAVAARVLVIPMPRYQGPGA